MDLNGTRQFVVFVNYINLFGEEIPQQQDSKCVLFGAHRYVKGVRLRHIT
jgi:hypothetical protein